MARAMTRRRAITIMAAAAGLPLLPFARQAAAATEPVVWNGQALGAPANLILYHDDRQKAEGLIDRIVVELSRLEAVFSLYRSESVLCELNRNGGVGAPPDDLVRLLQSCSRVWKLSGGLFDPTIQPLWALHARHFSTAGADPAGPSGMELEQALSRVGFDGVLFNRDRVAFARPGMALTFNGIAQGYITDRIVDLLRDAGVTSSLVNMGESRAIGAQADGRPWRVGLAQMEDAKTPDTVLNLVNKAVSTSSAAGFQFDRSGRFGHILDPLTGAARPHYSRMTVIAADATTADALSTAFSLMEPARVRSLAAELPDVTVDLVATSGEHDRFGSSI